MSLIGTSIIIYILLVDSSTSRSGAGRCDEVIPLVVLIVHVKEIEQKERIREISRDNARSGCNVKLCNLGRSLLFVIRQYPLC